MFQLLRARYDAEIPPTPGVSYEMHQFQPREDLIMLVPRTDAAALSIIHTSAIECNNAVDSTPHQTAAFYLSVLTTFFPGLLPLAKEFLRGCGYKVMEVTEDTAAACFISLEPWINRSTALAIFGQLALIMYKNIDEGTYTQSMQKWAGEIKNAAGAVDELVPGKGDVLLSVTTAKEIRTIVCSSYGIRRGLLTIILANREGGSRLNSVCNYLAESISWTDMAPVVAIFESFCVTDSPVFQDVRLMCELMNLAEAYKRIIEKDFPQYYRILHPTEAFVTIMKSRFVTFAEAARLYRSEQSCAVGRYASSRNSMLANELLATHRAFMTGANRSL